MISKHRKEKADLSVLRNLLKNPIYSKASDYHRAKEDLAAGKLSVVSSRPLLDNDELSLAYSPGVAAPCIKIYDNQDDIYEYTSKGNMIAVVSDGSAVLGLGDIGADASLPVMEGKCVLFKKFAGIDAIPIVIDERDPDKIVNSIASISGSWGGINLEDISGPRCFEIERKLQDAVSIPVMHDDQHGTAIVAGAGLINALDITNKKFEEVKMVVCGAGAAGIACLKFFILLGIKKENIILCDRHGVVRHGRTEEMDDIKLEFAISDTRPERTLTDAMLGADIFIGLSSAGIVTVDMIKSMARDPIIFAMANPEPEISPPLAKSVRPDSIIATGRSDFPNQINNVMGFPYIFRGALDVRASKINEEMKLAAAFAIADLARQPVHDDVFAAYSNRNFEYGPDYIIPTPFDPRLISVIAPKVAEAAMRSGVARISIGNFDNSIGDNNSSARSASMSNDIGDKENHKNVSDVYVNENARDHRAKEIIYNLEKYKLSLNAKLDPTVNIFQILHENLKKDQKTVIFAEGEEEKIIRSAVQFVENGYGEAILVGYEETIYSNAEKIGIKLPEKIKILNATICDKGKLNKYIKYYYEKNQRAGKIERDCIRDVKTDRNIFTSCALACGDADAMITGLTRNYYEALDEIKRAIETDDLIFGLSAIIKKGRIIYISDSAINISPDANQLSAIAVKTAEIVTNLAQVPRVAFVSYATFGNPNYGEKANMIREAVKILEKRSDLNFEFEGEMSVEVALNSNMSKNYPFSRLTQQANILIMPSLHSADISQKMIKSLSEAILVGPILVGFKNQVQIVSMTASVNEILNMAILASSGII